MKLRKNFANFLVGTIVANVLQSNSVLAGDLLDFLEDQNIISLPTDSSPYPGIEETTIEKECRATFENAHRWNQGSPNDRYWEQKCWEFVEKTAGGWKWVGDFETRKLAAEKKRKEDERRQKEVERLKKLEEKRLAEIERKRLEAEAKLLGLQQERQAKISNLVENYVTFSLNELEELLADVSDPIGFSSSAVGSKEIFKEELREIETYYASLIFTFFVEEEGESPLSALQRSFARSKSKGIDLSHVQEFPVAFFILNRDQPSDSASEGFDLVLGEWDTPPGLKTQTIEISDLDKSFASSKADFIALLDLKRGEVTRDVVKHESINSEFQSGERTLPNPAYDRKILETQNLMMEMNNAKRASMACSATCSGFACIGCLGYAAAFRSIKDKHSLSERRLSSTSPTITKPVYSDYAFKKNMLKIERHASANLFILDQDRSVVEKKEFNKKEIESFQLVYGLHDKDRYAYRHKKDVASEEDVNRYEAGLMTLSLGDVMNHGVTSSDEFDGLAIAEIFKEDGKGLSESQVLATVSTEVTFDKDLRFDSVVIVLHPGGGLGTGFYVDPETILTNYHVVEGSDFHEIVLYDGSESFGKVTSKNIALDLALLKVQKRGEPVTFFAGDRLPVGATVDAIGHPQGLEYSLTRGTISGIRRMPSLYDPGGKPVRFIQSDVAINPGNSGGPLFIGDEVVGVNDWKLADTDLEGLSFSIHISEVKKFLAKHGF